MGLGKQLSEDPLVSDFLQNYSKEQRFDVLRTTLQYGICQVRLHYADPIPIDVIRKTVLKAQVILDNQPIRVSATNLNSSHNSEEADRRVEETHIRVEKQTNPLANLTNKKFKISTGQNFQIPTGQNIQIPAVQNYQSAIDKNLQRNTLDDISIPDMTQNRSSNQTAFRTLPDFRLSNRHESNSRFSTYESQTRCGSGLSSIDRISTCSSKLSYINPIDSRDLKENDPHVANIMVDGILTAVPDRENPLKRHKRHRI